MKLNI